MPFDSTQPDSLLVGDWVMVSRDAEDPALHEKQGVIKAFSCILPYAEVEIMVKEQNVLRMVPINHLLYLPKKGDWMLMICPGVEGRLARVTSDAIKVSHFTLKSHFVTHITFADEETDDFGGSFTNDYMLLFQRAFKP